MDLTATYPAGGIKINEPRRNGSSTKKIARIPFDCRLTAATLVSVLANAQSLLMVGYLSTCNRGNGTDEILYIGKILHREDEWTRKEEWRAPTVYPRS